MRKSSTYARKRANQKRIDHHGTIYRVMTGLQPFTQKERTNLSLPVRLAFNAMLDGTATEDDYHTLAIITNLCMIVAEPLGDEALDVIFDAQDACMNILARHKRTGKWGMSAKDRDDLYPILDMHDEVVALWTPIQLQSALNTVRQRIDQGLTLTFASNIQNSPNEQRI